MISIALRQGMLVVLEVVGKCADEVVGKCADEAASKCAFGAVVIADCFARDAADARANKRPLSIVFEASSEGKQSCCSDDIRSFKHDFLPLLGVMVRTESAKSL